MSEQEHKLEHKIAAATAHRVCHSAEHDPITGRINGYCIVCGVPWPCETAKVFLFTSRAINIIFDGPPSHESGRFVEVETDEGESIKVGEWIEKEDGLWALRITELPMKAKT